MNYILGNGSNYPAGADCSWAPWNQEEPEAKEYEIEVMTSLVRKADIETHHYDMDGEMDLTNKEQVQLFEEQHYSVSSLLRILAERLKVDIEKIKENDNLTKRQKSQRLRVLQAQLEDCEAWEDENIEVI